MPHGGMPTSRLMGPPQRNKLRFRCIVLPG
jgi:hypothetical protein